MLTIGIKDAIESGDYVMIGDDIKVMLIKTNGTLRLSIDAPRHIPITRRRVYEENGGHSAAPAKPKKA